MSSFSVIRSATIALAAVSGFTLISNLTHTPLESEAIAATSGKPVTTQSGTAEISLAEHLTKTGAKMYGAHWCPYCHTQKQWFGAKAWEKVTYVECAQGGTNANPQACQKAGIESYPTWFIGNQKYVGTMSLFRLAKLSGYNGSTAFQNARFISR
jgi:glutaredoxin